RELVDRRLMIGLAGLELGGRELWVVRRIREVLRLQAKCRAMAVNLSTLAVNRAVEEVASIELNPGLGGEDLHDAPGFRLRDSRGERQAGAGTIQDKIVIVAPAEFQLFVGIVNTGSDGGGPAEVEGCAFDLAQLAGRDQGGVNRSKSVRVNHDLVLENTSVPLAGEVEVGMVGQIEHRIFVGRRRVFDYELMA